MVLGKRAHKRYIVSGVAQLETGGSRFPGRLVTVGGGGMLVRSKVIPPKDTLIGVGFSVAGFEAQSPLVATSTVVWTQPGEIGLKFVQEPPELTTLLAWLEREHSPWSGASQESAETS